MVLPPTKYDVDGAAESALLPASTDVIPTPRQQVSLYQSHSGTLGACTHPHVELGLSVRDYTEKPAAYPKAHQPKSMPQSGRARWLTLVTLAN